MRRDFGARGIVALGALCLGGDPLALRHFCLLTALRPAHHASICSCVRVMLNLQGLESGLVHDTAYRTDVSVGGFVRATSQTACERRRRRPLLATCPLYREALV